MGEHAPQFVAIAGGNASGKSSLATRVAFSMGINHIVSTDAIREVVREHEPRARDIFLHQSSFDAWRFIEPDPGRPSDRRALIATGYELHRRQVRFGVQAILRRYAKEGISAIIEGIHLSPDLFGTDLRGGVVYAYLGFEDKSLMIERFSGRATSRPQRGHGGLADEDFQAMWEIAELMRAETERSNLPVKLMLSAAESLEANARRICQVSAGGGAA